MPRPYSGWAVRILVILLVISVFYNLQSVAEKQEYYSAETPVRETFHSGDKDAEARIARIVVSGTIMPPYTKSTIAAVKRAREDDRVKGAVLVVNSPGGLVSDSNQIYRELELLAEKKPVYVAMKDLAASGGYYISMGIGPKGKIFAEPTTWTGSIGVIIPRFDMTELAGKAGVKVDPLKTGPLKDSLSPFREMTEQDLAVWGEILDDAFSRFVKIIADNRENLSEDQVRKLATGQIYTATQAKANGLVDEIGFEDEAIDALQKHVKLSKARIVTYTSPPTFLDLVTGNAKASTPSEQWRSWMELTVPRAMYYFSWLPVAPGVGESP